MQRRAAIDRFLLATWWRTSWPRSTAKPSGSADAEWAARTTATMRAKSPLSLKLALAQVRRGKTWDFETCMRRNSA